MRLSRGVPYTSLWSWIGRLERLVALAVVPAILPLGALAASPGRVLPLLPRYRYSPTAGDAYGYSYCAREILATTRRDAPLGGLALVGAIALVVMTRGLSRSPTTRVVATSCAFGLLAAVLAATVRFTGAAQFGWPLVWSVTLIPLRTIGAVSPDDAFGPGLALGVVCNAATVVATYVLGRRAGLREPVAFAGAALVALWPFVSLLAGSRAAANGTWQGWLGLSLYTEPLSTALVTCALASLLDRRRGLQTAAVAGALLGLATLVRLSDVLVFAAALLTTTWRRSWARAAALAAAAAVWAPAVLLYWPKGYPKLGPPTVPAHPFELRYAGQAWSHSYLWHPAVLIALVPPMLVGLRRVSGLAAVLLGGSIAVTAGLYTFYAVTPMHPRFLFVVLPPALLLWAAGMETLIASIARRWQPVRSNEHGRLRTRGLPRSDEERGEEA